MWGGGWMRACTRISLLRRYYLANCCHTNYTHHTYLLELVNCSPAKHLLFLVIQLCPDWTGLVASTHGAGQGSTTYSPHTNSNSAYADSFIVFYRGTVAAAFANVGCLIKPSEYIVRVMGHPTRAKRRNHCVCVCWWVVSSLKDQVIHFSFPFLYIAQESGVTLFPRKNFPHALNTFTYSHTHTKETWGIYS